MSFYDREGNAISKWRFLKLFHDKDYQVLRQTQVGPVMVSTVWLGHDHGFGFSDWPVIFETMVFGGPDEEQYRYADEATALRHHEELVAAITLLEEAYSTSAPQTDPHVEIDG